MARTNLSAALAVLAASSMLISATPARRQIEFPRSDWVIAIPLGSPVKFDRWRDPATAQFDGRFVLTGEYALQLIPDELCGLQTREDCLVLEVKPDRAIANRLPHVEDRGGELWITIRDERRLIDGIVTRSQRAALLGGKTQSVTGRVSIIVDQFWVGGECDGVWYSARFVKLAEPLQLARTKFKGGVGCGY